MTLENPAPSGPRGGGRERSGRRRWMLVVGAVVLVALVGTAAALWAASGQRRSNNVAGFARAPVGCDTTLDFDKTGTFFVFVETRGELDRLAGACDAPRSYDRDDVVEPALTLRDPDGAEVTLSPTDDVGYDVDGFVGTSIHRLEIDQAGDHVLTVEPTGGDAFAVAIGRSPDDGVTALRAGAIAALIGGLVLGGLFLVLGSRRSSVADAEPERWVPAGGGWPSSPPGFPAPPPTTGATGPALPATFEPPPLPGPPPPASSAGSPWAPPGDAPAQ